jgi:hypothetical protein
VRGLSFGVVDHGPALSRLDGERVGVAVAGLGHAGHGDEGRPREHQPKRARELAGASSKQHRGDKGYWRHSPTPAGNRLDSLRYLSDLEVVSKGWDMGAVIMLGTLFGLIVLVFGLVLRYDPEARRAPHHESDR